MLLCRLRSLMITQLQGWKLWRICLSFGEQTLSFVALRMIPEAPRGLPGGCQHVVELRMLDIVMVGCMASNGDGGVLLKNFRDRLGKTRASAEEHLEHHFFFLPFIVVNSRFLGIYRTTESLIWEHAINPGSTHGRFCLIHQY